MSSKLPPQPRQPKNELTISRRNFIILSSAALASIYTGCATNPVTGRKQLMLVSETGELDIDQQNAPHQFSADYGISQDAALNTYLTGIGRDLAARSHRPNRPYTCRAVNANYVNAYTFPGGTMAVTRGMLLAMQSEAELAAVLGHEIGHVCARHTGANISRSILTGALMTGIATYARYYQEQYANLLTGLGMVAGGAWLARYSRDNEREADALGLEYMTRAGYNPNGFIALMDILRRMSRNEPGLIELMFATHPMGEERYRTAVQLVNTQYQAMRGLPEHRERYLDLTAGIRAQKEAIQLMQSGELAMSKGRLTEAAAHLESASRLVPADYTALLLLAKCRLLQKQAAAAQKLAHEAKQVYPNEAQAWHVYGLAALNNDQYTEALANFVGYDRLLPGNPLNLFFRGLTYEKMGRRAEAADCYQQFLQSVSEGEQAQYAYQRLVDWGYVRPMPAK